MNCYCLWNGVTGIAEAIANRNGLAAYKLHTKAIGTGNTENGNGMGNIY